MAKYQEILDAVNDIREGFSRLDERTINTYSLVAKLEKHNAEQNGFIREQGKQVASNKTHIWWIIRVLVAAGVLGGGATGLVQWLG